MALGVAAIMASSAQTNPFNPKNIAANDTTNILFMKNLLEFNVEQPLLPRTPGSMASPNPFSRK
jgi:hypothetical protein